MTDKHWDIICFVGGAVCFVGGIAMAATGAGLFYKYYDNKCAGVSLIAVGVALLAFGVLRYWWKKRD